MIGVKLCGDSPYETCVTHGMVVDAEGRKMSKSLGNYVEPQEIIKTHGAEILRTWVSMVDYREEIAMSKETLNRVSEAYRKIRNTFRYFLSNLYDFRPDDDQVSDNEFEPLDRWALQQLSDLTGKVLDAYDSYEYHVVYHSLYRFCVVEMSAFYLDINKDRLYVSHPQSRKRRSAQTVMFQVLKELAKLAAPIFSFTTEEVWQEIPAFRDKPESVHFTEFEKEQKEWLTEAEKEDWLKLAEYRESVLKLLEEARQRKEIGSSLEASVLVEYPTAEETIVKRFETFLPELFIVSQVEIRSADQRKFEIRKAQGEKCMRCWQIRTDVGKNHSYPGVCLRCADVLEQLMVGKA
jgi:isoleucyl-tRNA synthetase